MALPGIDARLEVQSPDDSINVYFIAPKSDKGSLAFYHIKLDSRNNYTKLVVYDINPRFEFPNENEEWFLCKGPDDIYENGLANNMIISLNLGTPILNDVPGDTRLFLKIQSMNK